MTNLKDLLGCRCHAHTLFQDGAAGGESKTPAHTFPWAKNQYPRERAVWPLSQSLDLVLDVEKEELSGSNTIPFRVVQREIESFDFDAIDLAIHDVQVNKKSVKFTVSDEHTTVYLTEPMKRGDQGELKITYSCRSPRYGMYFIKPDKQYPSRPVQVWTQGQDDDAPFWFPTFDEPRIKCPVDLKVEVPAGFIATSNGALHSESRGGKTWTFHWKTSFLVPSYLVTLTAGKFSEIKEDWRGKPVVYLCEKGREEETKLSFGKTTKMMDLFSKLTGVDYPYEKYTQIAAAEFIFGGMENTSATTQTDATLHPYEIEEDFSSDDLVSHELAHQWFGDLVTCKHWSHAWLNEGWATFMEAAFKEHDLGRDEADYYQFDEFHVYQGEDQALYRRPIVTNFYSDPGEVWDRHLYQKGGLVLNLLRHELGEEDFWAGTKHYLNTFKGGVTETVDFQRALESVSGRSLQGFFDQWVFKAGYPELKASFNWDDKTKTAAFTLEQKQKTDELTPLFNLNIEVDFVFEDKSAQPLRASFSQKEQTFYVPLREKPLYARFDVGNHIPKTLEWGLPVEMLRAQLVNDTDVVGKVWAMKQLAKESTKQGVEALIDRLKSDEFWGVRAEAAAALGDTKTEDALVALVKALSEETVSKVRSRIASALGNFRDERAASALIEAIDGDKSIFVKGAACVSLGKTKSPKAFEKLKASLKIKSWNDFVNARVYDGFAQLRDDRAIDLFLEGARYGAPKFARLAAVSALGDYGLLRKDITEFLEELLNDKFTRVRFAAAGALARRKDPAAVDVLEEAGHRIHEGHFKAAAFRAARRLRAAQEKPVELVQFRESLDKLADENRKLRDRIQKLENHLN